MNCEHLRDKMYDYLDGTLSPADQMAVQEHLAGCLACRETVRREQHLAESLSRRLEKTVEAVSLDAFDKQHIVAAMTHELAAPRELPPVPFWRRLALPFAAAALLTVGIWIGYHFPTGQPSLRETASVSPSADSDEVTVHVTYSVPGYTFRQEGNLVIDALTSDEQAMNGSLLVINEKPQLREN